ncbi:MULTISPECIES: MFS transporter [Brevibacillus]|uniref:Putative MFS-type transporter YybF n=1 Tax=Brevibacillus parabrevis TaxID=54914 RepID=A0A4Y3PHU2_BREPA|nr:MULTISPECIES: MFS transporter [Brevibacillus]RNB96762.1 MFS transporter [Brevibacillus parabrevis]UED70488.1 MFS transporter [Brevibacillus sp. HD3.3A]GEB30769.1 putative MFS-type transporter YybF [Brevibacillus parabrevis]
MGHIKQGTATFRKTNLAFFAAGFNTFAILYSTQPLMPEFTKEFGISPTMASLSLSLTTISLSISMLIFGTVSEVWGRKPVMISSMLAASLLSILTACSTSYETLLLYRIIQGISLGGLPSIAMAYLGEEMEPKSLGVAMGLYISGNSLGAVCGRILSGTLTDLFNWHVAMGTISLMSLVATLVFWMSLPASQNFHARAPELRKLAGSMLAHLRDPALLCLFGIGFLSLGSNVALYNYIGYVLTAPPYSLSQTLVGWIFIVFLVGMFASVWMAKLAEKFGRTKMLLVSLLLTLIGACLTLDAHLAVIVAGLPILTFGFFGSHSIASGWVGKRATHDKAQASSLYLFFYYAGSSIGGTMGGLFWSSLGWGGVVAMIAGFMTVAFVFATKLSKAIAIPAPPVLEKKWSVAKMK